jgi:diacylglycerol O-acyltransferase / wax synthase
MSKVDTTWLTGCCATASREKPSFCGATLEQALFWVSQSGSVGLGVSILRYGGDVQFGVTSHSSLCPDPQAIIDQFAPEFDKIEWLALMLPWGVDQLFNK